MPVTLPPPTTKTKKGSSWQQFVTYWAKHGYPQLRANAPDIQAAAKAAKIDPIYFASLLLLESGADYKSNDSSKGAIGIGQLMPSTFVGKPVPWNPTRTITLQDLRDPTVNLRLAAYFTATQVGKFGYAGAYKGGYNPHYTGNAVDKKGQGPGYFTSTWDKSYIYQTTSTTPPSKAGQQVPGGTAPPAADKVFTDYYVAGVNKKGKFALTRDPNKAMQYDGAPMTRSSFLTLRDQLTSHYISYTGKRPSVKQIANYIAKGWNPYTLDVLLSKSAAFSHSPIYKQYAANFGAAMKDLLPDGKGVPIELLRQAAVNNWDGNAIAAHLRKAPGYLQSNEYKGQTATLANVYQSIMGMPDEKAQIAIHDAVLAGWSADQYAAYLRSHGDYSRSPEYQSKALGFLDALGLITGSQTILAQGNVPGPGAIGPKTQGKIPKDKRVKGDPNQPYPGLGLMPTLSST